MPKKRAHHRILALCILPLGVLLFLQWKPYSPPDVGRNAVPLQPTIDSVNSSTILNNSIQSSDIALGTITTNNLNMDLQNWISTQDANAKAIAAVRSSQDKAGAHQALLLQELDGLSQTAQMLNDTVVGLLDQSTAPIEEALITASDIAQGAITAAALAIDSIGSATISNGAIVLEDLSTNLIDELTLGPGPGSITTGLLADGAVTGQKILGSTITGDLLMADSISSGKIIDGGIGTSDISLAAITGSLIASGAVGTSSIAPNAVTSALLASGAVTSGNIAPGAVTLTGLADGAVTSAKIANATITATQLAANSVTAAKVLDGTITTNDISAEAITNALLAIGAVDTTKIAAGAITNSLLGVGAVGTANIAAAAITNTLLGSGAVNTSNIANGAITSALLASGAVGAGHLADNAISSAKIQDGTILAGDISSGAVGAAQLASGAVSLAKLSPAASTRVVSTQIGNVSASLLSVLEWPVFVAPTNGTITKVSFTNGANISTGITLGSLSLMRKTASAATVASVSLTSTPLTAFLQQTPSITAGAAFSTGDVYSFRYAPGVLGVALTGFLVTIEYTPSE